MSTVTESPAKRGRPPGEETPEALLRRELISHLKLYRKMRELVEARLETGTVDADELAKYMDLLRKGIVEMSKPFVASARPEAARAAEIEEDPSAILNRLLNGETR